MKIGSIIKCYDFNTTDDYYMEGRITEIDNEYKLLVVKTTDVVRGGKSCEFGKVLGNDVFTTPMLGYSATDDMDRMIRKNGNVVKSPNQSRIVEVAA
jgi:hypothetical protein